MDDEIDINRFILEVEIRPEVWDLQEAAYANRDKKALWDEENTAISRCVWKPTFFLSRTVKKRRRATAVACVKEA